MKIISSNVTRTNIIISSLLSSAAAEVRTITKINQLDTNERLVVNWVKKYTVPNTLNKDAKRPSEMTDSPYPLLNPFHFPIPDL